MFAGKCLEGAPVLHSLASSLAPKDRPKPLYLQSLFTKPREEIVTAPSRHST